MSNSLLETLLNASSNKNASVLGDSESFSEKDVIPTDLPVLNIAFSGRLDGGLVSGITVFAGESKSYKTLLSLYCMKAYFDKYADQEHAAIVYDSEGGINKEYFANYGIDPQKVAHIEITNIEELKFDIVKRLQAIKRGDKVFIMIDSLGALASKKETDDAGNEKSVADITRAKEIRSLLRLITPHMTMKDIPCIIINHTYKTLELYSKDVISGGSSVMYTANQAFIITRSQEKDSSTGEIEGWNFSIKIEKSRWAREKSKLTFQVLYDQGIVPWSGLFDIAMKSGHIQSPSKGWYIKKGEEKKLRMSDMQSEEFWDSIINDESFKQFVSENYSLTVPNINPGDDEDLQEDE